MSMTKEWYTVDNLYENGTTLSHKYDGKDDAVDMYGRMKNMYEREGGGRVRLCHHVEQINVLKDEVVLGKGK